MDFFQHRAIYIELPEITLSRSAGSISKLVSTYVDRLVSKLVNK